MKLRSRKIFAWSGTALFVVIWSVCWAEQGTVIDDATGKPIAGAQILVYWEGRVPMPVQSSGQCFGLRATTSDLNGHFYVPGFSGNFNPLVQKRHRLVEVAARGYREKPNAASDRLLYSMRPLADPKVDPERAAEDLKIFRSIGGSCVDPEKLKVPYLRVNYQNLEMLANNDREREDLIGYLSYIERIEFGEKIAAKNYAARIAEFRNSQQTKERQK